MSYGQECAIHGSEWRNRRALGHWCGSLSERFHSSGSSLSWRSELHRNMNNREYGISELFQKCVIKLSDYEVEVAPKTQRAVSDLDHTLTIRCLRARCLQHDVHKTSCIMIDWDTIQPTSDSPDTASVSNKTRNTTLPPSHDLSMTYPGTTRPPVKTVGSTVVGTLQCPS